VSTQIWKIIGHADVNLRKLRSYITAYREMGAKYVWADRLELSVSASVESLGRIIQKARRDLLGEYVLEIDEGWHLDL
jgi:hypothetical protein